LAICADHFTKIANTLESRYEEAHKRLNLSFENKSPDGINESVFDLLMGDIGQKATSEDETLNQLHTFSIKIDEENLEESSWVGVELQTKQP